MPERERAVFELVQQAVIDVTQITAEDVMRLSDLGWSDSDIVEMIDVAAFAIGEALFGDVLIEVLNESGKKFKLE